MTVPVLNPYANGNAWFVKNVQYVNNANEAVSYTHLCENSDMHTLCIVNGEKDSDFVQMTYTMLPELKTCPSYAQS